MFLNWLRVVHDSKEQRQNDSEIHALLFPLFGFSANGLVFTLRARRKCFSSEPHSTKQKSFYQDDQSTIRYAKYKIFRGEELWRCHTRHSLTAKNCPIETARHCLHHVPRPFLFFLHVLLQEWCKAHWKRLLALLLLLALCLLPYVINSGLTDPEGRGGGGPLAVPACLPTFWNISEWSYFLQMTF